MHLTFFLDFMAEYAQHQSNGYDTKKSTSEQSSLWWVDSYIQKSLKGLNLSGYFGRRKEKQITLSSGMNLTRFVKCAIAIWWSHYFFAKYWLGLQLPCLDFISHTIWLLPFVFLQGWRPVRGRHWPGSRRGWSSSSSWPLSLSSFIGNDERLVTPRPEPPWENWSVIDG